MPYEIAGDMLITNNGAVHIFPMVPRTTEAIESMMKQPWSFR
ncbi:hypothetical protein [Maribacter sp. MMG018]|nr:hypothetical protein [Maribacter sp. MMG018]